MRPGWGDGEDNSVTVTLEPLTGTEATLLVEDLLGGRAVAPDVLERIVERTEGFPLLAEEVVSALVDEGRLILQGDRWAPTADFSRLSLPSTISGLMTARLERLDLGERAVIEHASVVGRDFLASEVAALSASEERGRVEERLDGLIGTVLMRRTEGPVPGERGYRFRHMLLLDAAYEGMHKTRRAELHERYASWLSAWTRHRSEKYEEVLAYHLEQAYRLRSEVGPAGNDLDRSRRAGSSSALARGSSQPPLVATCRRPPTCSGAPSGCSARHERAERAPSPARLRSLAGG